MASRRMFSHRIINSARFLMMPISCQALYFHLGMNADDDGIVEAYPIIKMVGCTADDLKVLYAKGFVQILNEELVTFITDWNENNKIRPDRKIDSIYKDLLIQLNPDISLIEKRPRADAKSHTGQSTDGQRTDNGQPKDSIGKVRLGKDRLGQDIDINTIVQNSLPNTEEKTFRKKHSDVIDERFEQFWKVYPRKQGKGKARDVFNKINPSESLLGKMMTAVLAASASVQWKKDNGQFIPLPATWLNQERWEDEINPDMGKPDPKQTKGTRFANFEQRQYTYDDDAIGTAWLKKGEA